MNRFAIVVAGGTGSRMQASLPKQFLTLAGEPILMHTLRMFQAYDPGIGLIVVLPQAEIGRWELLCGKYNFAIPHQITSGGETRFHSVLNGLKLVPAGSLVGVHDGVRPILSKELLDRCYSAAMEHGSAIPCIPVNESLRKVAGTKSEIVSRSEYRIVQTPQCFTSELLKDAYETDYRESFTDDASVVEMAGHSVHLVEGDRRNIKITWPEDLLLAEVLLGAIR